MDVRVAQLYIVYAFIVLAFGLGGVVPPPAQQPPAATRHRRDSGQHLLSLSGPDRIPAMQCAAPGKVKSFSFPRNGEKGRLVFECPERGPHAGTGFLNGPLMSTSTGWRRGPPT